MTEKDFMIPERILTFFNVSRKAEAFRMGLDKNIYFDFISLFYFWDRSDGKVVLFQFPTILAPKV